MRMVYQFTISNFTLIFFFSVTSELYNTLNKIALHFAAGVNCRHLLCVLCCVFLWQFRFRFQFQFRFNSRSRFPFNLYCVVCICILKWPNCHCPYAQLRIKNPESRIENIEYRVYNNLNCVISFRWQKHVYVCFRGLICAFGIAVNCLPFILGMTSPQVNKTWHYKTTAQQQQQSSESGALSWAVACIRKREPRELDAH